MGAEIQIWNMEQKRKIHQFDLRDRSYSGVAITKDGKKAVYASFWGYQIVDTFTGQQLRLFKEGQPEGFVDGGLRFSPDEKMIVGWYHTWVRGLDVDTGKKMFEFNTQESRMVSGVSEFFSGENNIVVAENHFGAQARYDGTITIWDLTQQKPVKEFYKSQGIIVGLTVSGDGNLVAASEQDRGIKVWEIATAKLIRQIPKERVSWRSPRLLFLQDFKTLVYQSDSETEPNLFLTNIESGETNFKLIGHKHSGQPLGFKINSLSATPDGSTLASAGSEGMVCIWDLKNLR